MADTISFIQGSDSLVLNTGDYAVKEIDLTSGPPDALTHMPDYGENRVVRTEDKDRQATLQMRIIGADWDDVYNNIAEIRRWLKEAARAEVDGDTDTVYLQLKRSTAGSTATNATNNQIRYGWVDGDSSAWTPYGQNVEQALVIFVHLVLTPYGEAATAITLANVLTSSPHFVEDSDADGLADGWNNTANPATTISLNATSWLVGGQSQQFVTDNASTEGVISDVVTIAIATDLVAYAWITAGLTHDPVTIQLVDGGGTNIDNIEYDPSGPTGYDKSTVDAVGVTWYRYVVSGPNAGAANAKLIIQRTAGNASIITTFRVDACYVATGTLTAPDAWMSARNIDNRDDPVATSAATENYINYLDVWGIPGDAPAEMLLTNTYNNAVLDEFFVWGLEQDGKNLAVDIPFVIESDDLTMTTGTGVFDATQGAGAYHGGDRARYTEDAGANGCTLSYVFSAADSAIIAGREFKVYASCMSDDDAGNIALDILAYDGTVQSRTAHIAVASNFELKNIGVLRPSPLMDSEASTTVRVYFDIAGIANGKFFEVDVIFLMPVDKGAVITEHLANHGIHYLDGPRNSAYSYYATANYVGKVFDLLPGSITNRLRVLMYGSAADDFELLSAFAVALTITPRTRHLLGTM